MEKNEKSLDKAILKLYTKFTIIKYFILESHKRRKYMKRFSKIFALLLALCLLCGMVSIIASAAELNATKLNSGSTGITNRKTYTFENGISSDGYPLDVTGNTKYTGLTRSVKVDEVNKRVIDSTLVEDKNGNHYLRYHAGEELVEAMTYTSLTYLANSAYRAPDYKYVVYDIDFTADAYLNADGSAIDPDATSGKLAYPEAGGIALQGNVNGAYLTNAFLVSNGNDWYLASATNYSSAAHKIKIEKTEAGDWNHLTLVFDTAGRYFAYLNGTYAWSGTAVSNDSNPIYNSNVNFRVMEITNERQYTFCIDNLTSNAYDATYASADDVYGLDDFLASDYSCNIAFCEDVVYNYDNYEDIDEAKTKFLVGDKEYALLSSALEALPPNGTLTSSTSFILPCIASAKNFKVVCENGAKLTLENVAFSAYRITNVKTEGNNTTYSLVLDPSYQIEGISTYASENFNSGKKFDAQNNDFSNHINITNQTSSDGNGYVSFTPKASGTVPSNTTGLYYAMVKNGTNTVKEHSYYVVEFDFATNGTSYEGMALSMYRNKPGGAYSHFGYTVSNDGKWYIGNAKTYATSTNLYELPAADVWTHFTLIAYDDGTNFGFDVYINGEYFQTLKTATGFRMERLCLFVAKNSVIDVNDKWEIRMDNVSAKSYGTTEKPYFSGSAFGLDDYKALGDKTLPLTFLDDIAYNSVFAFSSPNTPSVNIGGENYYNLASALSSLNNGDTITLTEDLKLYAPLASHIKTLKVSGANIVLLGEAANIYTFENGVLTKKLLYTANWTDGTNVVISQQINCATAPSPDLVTAEFGIRGDYKRLDAWEISFGGEFAPLNSISWTELENGAVVTLRPITGTVAWFDSDGVTQVGGTEVWFVGSTLEIRGFDGLKTFAPLDNGWYEWGYTSWISDSTDYVVDAGENNVFVAKEGAISAIDAKFNYNLGTAYYSTLYLPKELENVKITGVSQTANAANAAPAESIKGKSAIINGAEYTAYVGAGLAVYNWYPTQNYYVTFEVTIDEKVYTIQTTFVTSMSSYISTVLNTYDCGSVEEKLVLNWIRYVAYSYGALYASDGGLLSAAEKLLTNHDATCIAATLSALSAETPDAPDTTLTYKEMSEIGSGFGASFALLGSHVRFGVYVPVEFADANPDMKVTLSLRGIANKKTNQNITANFFRYTIDDKGTEVTPTYKVGGVDCYLYTVENSAISMYNINEILTVSFKAGEIDKTVTYSLGEYIYNLSAKLAAKEEPSAAEIRALECVQALAAFGKASKAYVLDGVEIPE